MELQELPEAELILPGLEDLHNGNSESVGALLIAIASTRLTEAGLNFYISHLLPEPELPLYDRLQHERDDAYPSLLQCFIEQSQQLLQCARTC